MAIVAAPPTGVTSRGTGNRLKSCNVAMLPSASIYRLLPSYFVIETFVEIRSHASDVHLR